MLQHNCASLFGVSEKKLTAANSFFIDGVAFYVVKKNDKGKAFSFFAAYLYPSGISITFGADKEKLKEHLGERIGEVKKFMEDHEIKGI